MTQVDVVLSVTDCYLKRIPELVQKLQDHGMTNIKTMEAIGAIAGSIDEAQIADIAKIEGVDQVERSQEISLPPPDSPIQ